MKIKLFLLCVLSLSAVSGYSAARGTHGPIGSIDGRVVAGPETPEMCARNIVESVVGGFSSALSIFVHDSSKDCAMADLLRQIPVDDIVKELASSGCSDREMGILGMKLVASHLPGMCEGLEGLTGLQSDPAVADYLSSAESVEAFFKAMGI